MKAYHGTSTKAAEQIRKSGFDVKSAGARQAALRGERVAEWVGVYLTADKMTAKWYAGETFSPGLHRGGVVVEVEVNVKLAPSKELWTIARQVDESLGDYNMWDQKERARRIAITQQRLRDRGYGGFYENADEFIVFDPKRIKVVRLFNADTEETLAGKRLLIASMMQAGRPELANAVAYHVTAAKELYYHGTSTVFAKRILSEGFVPNPKRKVWNPERGRLASYDGTYFSKNFGTASSSAQNAAIKFNGRKCVFEVQLETRTGLMDEDQLPSMMAALTNASGGYRILESLHGKVTDKWSSERGRKENEEWLASSRAGEVATKAAQLATEDFVRNLRDEVKPLADRYTKGLRDAAYRWAWAMLHAAADGHEVHRHGSADTPDIRAAKNDFMRAAGSVAKQQESFMGNNARITTPVAFRGANRILAAVVEPQRHDPIEQGRDYKDPKPVYVVYGNPSGNFISKMREAWSPNLDLIKTSLSRIPNVFDPYHKREKVAASTDTYFIWLTGDVTFNRKAISRALRELGVKYSRESDPSGLQGFRVALRDTQRLILESKIELARSDAGKPEGGYRIEQV